ncbi:ABC transporter ATP-binding protein [Microbacterium sp. R86528]|uniref:ABC transporter ATP-binding protein n=1 Tax=Microbacterium sp. R86528 TaxID=3093864 RepID=UPI0037C87F8D
MTASLPAPNDFGPDDAENGSSTPVFQLKSVSPRAKKAGARVGTSKTKPRKKPVRSSEPIGEPDVIANGPAIGTSVEDSVWPGPPPPLPTDLVGRPASLDTAALDGIEIPPKPPLPAHVQAAAAGAVTDVTAGDAAPGEGSAIEEPEADNVDAGPAEAELLQPEPAEAEPEQPEPEEAETEEAQPEEAAPVQAEPESAEPEQAEPEDAEDAEPEQAESPSDSAAFLESGTLVDEDAPEHFESEVDDAAAPLTQMAGPSSIVDEKFLGVQDVGVESASDVLVMRGVTKRFGEVAAVDGIDLTIPAGTFYGLVGPNGAGKTTTLSMIAGLLTPDKGTVHVGGIDAASDPRGAKRLMGVLPDRLRTFDRLTGRQLLYYYGVLRGLKPSVAESRTTDLARAFDLTDALGRVVSDYSAGMLKKVMLAGALIHSPRLLVLDEPFEAVDPVSSAVIIDILTTYVAHGGTVVLSSHGMELVERMCTRVAVIVAGQVLAEGTVEEVRGELTLEQRFVELAGGLSDVEGLEWLHTFSD